MVSCRLRASSIAKGEGIYGGHFVVSISNKRIVISVRHCSDVFVKSCELVLISLYYEQVNRKLPAEEMELLLTSL